MIENTFRTWKEEYEAEELHREARAKVNYLMQTVARIQESLEYPRRLRLPDALHLLKRYEAQASEVYKPYFQYYIRILESAAFVSSATTHQESASDFILTVSSDTLDPEWAWVPKNGSVNCKNDLPPVFWYL